MRAVLKAGGARLYCAARQQRGACAAPSARLDDLETDVLAIVRCLRLPPAEVERAARAVVARPADDLAQRRRDLAHQRERLTKLYQWGDLTDTQYQAERARLDDQLAALPAAPTDAADELRAIADRLADLARLWADADGAERNRLLRLIAERAEIEDGALKELVLSDEAALVIEAACQHGSGDGSDGIRTRDLSLDSVASQIPPAARPTLFYPVSTARRSSSPSSAATVSGSCTSRAYSSAVRRIGRISAVSSSCFRHPSKAAVSDPISPSRAQHVISRSMITSSRTSARRSAW
jgi:hypothetical protein